MRSARKSNCLALPTKKVSFSKEDQVFSKKYNNQPLGKHILTWYNFLFNNWAISDAFLSIFAFSIMMIVNKTCPWLDLNLWSPVLEATEPQPTERQPTEPHQTEPQQTEPNLKWCYIKSFALYFQGFLVPEPVELPFWRLMQNYFSRLFAFFPIECIFNCCFDSFVCLIWLRLPVSKLQKSIIFGDIQKLF